MKTNLFIVISLSFLMLISCNKKTRRSTSGEYSIVDPMIISCSNIKQTSFQLPATIIPDPNKIIVLEYKTHYSTFPKAWDISFCDNTGCHLSLPESNSLVAIQSSDNLKQRQLTLLVETHGKNGKGVLQLIIYQKQNLLVDTLLYSLNYNAK